MNRRTLLTGVACATTLGLAGITPHRAVASAGRRLTVASRTIEVNGKAAKVYGLIGPDGSHGLSFDAEGMFDVVLDNQLTDPTMIHWHGLTPPVEFDGVPDMPMPLLKAGEQRAYRFPVGGGGTHWMHAHTLQEQNLLAAPLIVRTAEDRATDEQDVVILLHDFSFTPAAELLANLKGGDVDHGTMDHSQMGHGNMDVSKMDMGSMDMSKMDLNDIAYDAYLANDRTLDDPEIVQVEKGGRIRLRIINGATATGFTIDLGHLNGQLIAVDGQPVAPVNGTRFPLNMGQRADIRLKLPSEGGAFPVLALREGAPERTGIVLASPGSRIERVSPTGDAAGPVLNLGLESTLQAARPLTSRPADRKFMVHLTGNMAGYSWGMSGEPIKVRSGERIEIEMMNMSMMSHPMHLHGHHFQIVAINGQRFQGAVRDTVLVPPMQSVTFAVDANNPAKAWAFHCHHLYHMASGMMSSFGYENIA
jgi:FtsP/CotA-like multicopper oxidase with cupredoxin domain